MVDPEPDRLDIREALFAMSLYLQQQLAEGVTDLVEVIYDFSPQPQNSERTEDPGSWDGWKTIFDKVKREGGSEDAWLPSTWERATWHAPNKVEE